MSNSFDYKECDSTSTSSKMVSALSSVSEKAKKSLFISISFPLRKQNTDPDQMAKTAEFAFLNNL